MSWPRRGPARQGPGRIRKHIEAALPAALFCLGAAAAPCEAPETPLWAAMPASLLPSRLPVKGGVDDQAWAVQATASDFEASDVTPVRAFGGDWSRYTPRNGNNVALQSGRAEVGASHRSWELSTLLRSEILVVGTRAAFDAVHFYKQRTTPADGSELDAEADATGVVFGGLRGARTWVVRPGAEHGLRLTAAFSLLSVQRVQHETASGRVRYSEATGYHFDARTLRQDSRRQFGGYGSERPTGQGQAVDLGLLWCLAPTLFVNLSVVDLWSRLRVGGVSTEQMTASSSTRTLDANGYLEYRPLLSGRDSAADLNLKLPRKSVASAGACASLPGLCGGLRWESVGGVDMPALWASVSLAAGWRLLADAEARFRSVGLGLASRHAALMLRTRSLPAGASSALGWHLEFSPAL